MTILSYIEQVADGDSPSSYTAGIDQTNASHAYQILNVGTDPAFFDLLNIEVLGDCILGATDDANFSRLLPLQHPYLPCYASQLSNVRGFGMSNAGGQSFQLNSTANSPWFPTPAQYPMYPNYRFNITYTTRPYPVLPDAAIFEKSGSWYKFDGTAENFTYYTEYERFCFLTVEPSGDAVSAQAGMMAFNAQGLTRDARQFHAQPRKMLNNSNLTIHWQQIPFSYITSSNSYIDQFRGCINQNTITSLNLGTFLPGQLLYLNYKVMPYVPPSGIQTAMNGDIETFQRFCNVDLIFQYTTRTAGAAPLDPPTNRNYIDKGHNLMPFLGNGSDALSGTFLYASTVPTSKPWASPLWPSAPLEVLFTNPDAAGPI